MTQNEIYYFVTIYIQDKFGFYHHTHYFVFSLLHGIRNFQLTSFIYLNTLWVTVGDPLHRVDNKDMAVDIDWEYFIPDSGMVFDPPLEPK